MFGQLIIVRQFDMKSANQGLQTSRLAVAPPQRLLATPSLSSNDHSKAAQDKERSTTHRWERSGHRERLKIFAMAKPR